MGKERFAKTAMAIIESGCIEFDKKLKNNEISPIYIDLRKLQSNIQHKKIVVAALADLILPFKQINRLAPIPTGAIYLTSSVCDQLDIPQITPRLEKKDHGMRSAIDGVYYPGDIVGFIEDTVTSGKSALKSVNILLSEKLRVEDGFCVIDRLQGGRELFAENGVRLHSLGTLPQLVDVCETMGMIDLARMISIRKYIQTECIE